jgi:NAD+ synthase (glutamine-hydrolysing)
MIANHMIKISCAVPELKVGDPVYNSQRMSELMHEVRDTGLLVFPELSITGYTCADLFQQDSLLNETVRCLLQLAHETAELSGMTVVVGAPLRHQGHLYNCAVFMSDGKIKGAVPKIHVPNYGEFYEARWFASGKDVRNETLPQLNDIPFGVDLLFEDHESTAVIGTDICEDLWVMDKPSSHACAAGANIIVNLSASDELIGKEEYRRSIVTAQSAAAYCAYAYVSCGTDESSTDLVFSGHAMIAENGRLLTEGIYGKRPAVYSAVVDLDACSYNRIHQNTYSEAADVFRRIPVQVQPVGGRIIKAAELARVLTDEQRTFSRYPFVPQERTERARRCRSILAIQANGLATRVRNTGIKTLVIGISGGLDSTLALLVCHEAKKIVPDIRIIAYTLPNHGNTTSHTYNNAVRLMHLLSDECREVAIDDSVRKHLQDIGHSPDYQGSGDTAYENAQARMRTYILMDAANMENGLVVGTGDLSELALGWCTYNGDHMSMYAVNASVPKTLVQFICRTYAETCHNEDLEDVLISICDTPITPELTPNQNGEIAQKTEEKIGKYDLNDFFLFYVLRYGIDPERLYAFAMAAYDDVDPEEIRKAEIRFYQRFFHQQFKRSCLPDGPKVGSVTLSPRGDWRMPSDACVDGWIRQIEEA